MKRQQNEDSLLLLPEENLFCVADGMGGHQGGEIASRMAMEEMREFFRMTAKDSEATWPYKMDKARNYDENRLITGIKLANVRIYEQQANDSKVKGMGTTIASIHFVQNAAYIGHVGDSRVYLFRRGELQQVTEDHSWLNDVLKTKKLSPAEIESFPHKNVIMRALGMNDTVQVDTRRQGVEDQDVFLLCSDGLSGMVSDDVLRNILLKTRELDKACQQLIDMANAAGGNDNVTCVLIRANVA